MNLGFIGLIDIIVIVLGLIVCFLGFSKGFMNKVIGMLGILVIFGLAVFLCANFAEMLITNKIIYPSIYKGIYSKMATEVAEAGSDASVADIIQAALGCPSLIAVFLAGKIDVSSTSELPDVVAAQLGTYAMIGISFLILIFSMSLVLVILKVLANTLRKSTLIKTVDGIMGMALYLLIYVAIISLLFWGLRALMDNDVIQGQARQFIITDLQLENENASRLSKFFYEGNLFSSIQDLFK